MQPSAHIEIQKQVKPAEHNPHEAIAPSTLDLVDNVKPEPSADLHDLDAKIESMIDFSENRAGERSKDGRARVCKVCGKEGHRTQIKNHVESNHIAGVIHT